MNITIYYFETKVDKNIEVLIDEYLKRMKWKVKIVRFPASSSDISARCKQEEAKLILSKLGQDFVICLSEEGKHLDSLKFSTTLVNIANNSFKSIAFIIGGAFGIDDEVKKSAKLVLSLSNMTFPHKIAKLILVEQIYRAYMIQSNKSYHIA